MVSVANTVALFSAASCQFLLVWSEVRTFNRIVHLLNDDVVRRGRVVTQSIQYLERLFGFGRDAIVGFIVCIEFTISGPRIVVGIWINQRFDGV